MKGDSFSKNYHLQLSGTLVKKERYKRAFKNGPFFFIYCQQYMTSVPFIIAIRFMAFSFIVGIITGGRSLLNPLYYQRKLI